MEGREMNKRLILGFILSLMCCLQGVAFDFTEADTAYRRNDFEKARAIYLQALQEEGVSAGLLFNLGNTYYRLGDDGEAILCYERARKLDPGNSRIRQNLDFLTTKVMDANRGSLHGKTGNIEPDQETFMESLYRMIAIDRSSNGWAIFAVMAFILFLGAAAMYVFTPNVLARKTGFFSGITFIGFTLIFIIFAFLAASEYKKQDKVILMDFTNELLLEPNENASSAGTTLHKGTKLQILETKKAADGTEWLKLKLNQENTGWLKKESVEVI